MLQSQNAHCLVHFSLVLWFHGFKLILPCSIQNMYNNKDHITWHYEQTSICVHACQWQSECLSESPKDSFCSWPTSIVYNSRIICIQYYHTWHFINKTSIPSSVMITFTEVDGEQPCIAPKKAPITSPASSLKCTTPTGCPTQVVNRHDMH